MTPRNLLVFPLCFFLLLLCACAEEEQPTYTTIQGALPPDIEEAHLNYDGEWEELLITEEGRFEDTLPITQASYVQLSLGDYNTRVYFTPGDQVLVSIDSVLSFSGSNAVINDYLYQVYQEELIQEEVEYESHERIFNLNETEYISYRDSIKTVKLERLAQLPAGTEAFQDFHQKDILFDYQYDVARYPNYYSFFYQDYEPTELITDFYKGVSLDNEPYARNYSSYRSLVDLILYKQIDDIMLDSTASTLEAHLSVIQDIQSPTILHRRLLASLPHFNSDEQQMEAIRDRMLGMAKLDRTKEAITDHYNVISQLKPGNASPVFDFENYAGGRTKLSDLRGKYVYIDVWATWCGPCILEIPHLKEIEETFHNANI
ncbi:MAG: TlpA disulfide reductase family protein, partial [Bacteroidota bacterium]